jgi:cytoskeletal protein CcmA (bactofilin family)
MINETSVTLISEGTQLQGNLRFNDVSRVHGRLKGDIIAEDGSTLILGETSVVEGKIQADTLVVDGYVHGDIFARTKVVLSRTARVIGNIRTASLKVEFGAYFDGKCIAEEKPAAPAPISDRPLKPA